MSVLQDRNQVCRLCGFRFGQHQYQGYMCPVAPVSDRVFHDTDCFEPKA